jgi:DNA-binding winged helix-turn-helix (wHTH) protein
LGDHLLRFAGFELDQQRAELRSADGTAIKLRPKTFEMLRLFATSGGRVLTKQELMEVVWPNVHVGEDSLFQCIRELRTALGDNRRQLIKLASGGGYLLATEVVAAPPQPRRRPRGPGRPRPARSSPPLWSLRRPRGHGERCSV